MSDIDWLEHIRTVLSYDKLFVVAPQSYFTFHGEDNDVFGMTINPYWEPSPLEDGFWNLWGLLAPLQLESEGRNLGGSWNVAFISEDTRERGTVSHELAHTLGQGREFYDPNEMCRQFKRDPLEPCEDYEIPLALDADHQSWRFYRKQI